MKRRRLAQAAAGVALGLAIAEGAFHLRDHGAFPHLNIYVPDARLGVRLRPGAEERILFGGNPRTSLRVSVDGFRGADLPPPGDGEIVVVGDSQVFGLGVEEGETASALLPGLLGGRTVINAGVPTYGPPEYNAVAAELLAKRRVRTLIYVVNMVNDLFEAAHPNTERHVVWDGWAVRKETAPESITSFPGRELLFGRSHLVYAIRSFLYARGPALDEQGFASEGTARDLVSLAARAGDEHARAARETEAHVKEREASIDEAQKKELAVDLELEGLTLDMFDLRGKEKGVAYQQARNNPGDIVIHSTGRPHQIEEERVATTTVTILINGAELRRQMEERVRAFAELEIELDTHGVQKVDALPPEVAAKWKDDPHGVRVLAELVARGLVRDQGAMPPGHGVWVIGKGRAHPMVRTFEEHEALRKRLEELRKAPAQVVRAWSPLSPHLREVKAACDAHGAKLLVVALPMDVQVSPAEWAKYGVAESVDMAPTRILLEDVVASAEAIGAAALDATPALAAAEPGAFLRGDIHMTPAGQRALAEAIAAKLRAME